MIREWGGEIVQHNPMKIHFFFSKVSKGRATEACFKKFVQFLERKFVFETGAKPKFVQKKNIYSPPPPYVPSGPPLVNNLLGPTCAALETTYGSR